jgi:hypothetical protein
MIKPTPRKPEVFAYSAVDATGSKAAKTLFKNAFNTYHATGLLPSELAAQRDQLLAALTFLAAFPLEEFAMEDKPDDRTLTGFNEWHLTVGDIRRARVAITNAKGKTE